MPQNAFYFDTMWIILNKYRIAVQIRPGSSNSITKYGLIFLIFNKILTKTFGPEKNSIF